MHIQWWTLPPPKSDSNGVTTANQLYLFLQHPYPQSQPQAINANVVVSNYPQRLSGHGGSFPGDSRHSYDSSAALSRQSFHSQSSSSSVGSLDILDEGGFSSNVNVAELYQRGMSVSAGRFFNAQWKVLENIIDLSDTDAFACEWWPSPLREVLVLHNNPSRGSRNKVLSD